MDRRKYLSIDFIQFDFWNRYFVWDVQKEQDHDLSNYQEYVDLSEQGECEMRKIIDHKQFTA
jgi:hypothetical protein